MKIETHSAQRARKLYYEGVNKTADAGITRVGENGKTEILLVQRPDGSWCLPGGFVEPEQLRLGEYGNRVTASKELSEEAKLVLRTGAELDEEYSILFNEDEKIYQGKVDDPLNEEDRWIETTLYHRHFGQEEGRKLLLKNVISDNPEENEVKKAKWFNLQEAVNLILFASHKNLINQIINNLDKKNKNMREK